jgi:DNA (cytosine-5)-methyltransferase 1
VCHGGGIASGALLRGLGSAGLAMAIEVDGSYLDQSLTRGPAAKGGFTFEGDLGDLGSDPDALAGLPECDVLEAGLPCISASRAGRAKKALAQPEDDEATADLAHAFLNVVTATRPAVVVLENVPEYASSASAQGIRRNLRRLGYVIHEVALDGAQWALEARQRWIMVAVTRGLDFDPALIVPTERPAALGEVLDRCTPAKAWTSNAAREAKAARDKANGNGFSRGRRFLAADATSVPTLRRGYQKDGSCDPRLMHPTRAGISRLFSAAEHARIKGIPPALVAGLSEKKAHEVLGQSVIAPAFVALGAAIAASVR